MEIEAVAVVDPLVATWSAPATFLLATDVAVVVAGWYYYYYSRPVQFVFPVIPCH